ncbi:unnamed protein product [Prunus armeniaca]|uniref:Uncharacterized protein n=1 Tax=Prunus armeniaca TaxID=36596 RepID=A0A6J5U095_PRUAR|nr:unnamed protein product [Prunus armeniaca]CAB4299947.1 unnamed protein product [Prunus armeniaca]
MEDEFEVKKWCNNILAMSLNGRKPTLKCCENILSDIPLWKRSALPVPMHCDIQAAQSCSPGCG